MVCANFAALQDGAAVTNDTLTTVGVAGGARGGVLGTIVGGLSTFGAFISSITTGSGFRPFGVSIFPKSAPPSRMQLMRRSMLFRLLAKIALIVLSGAAVIMLVMKLLWGSFSNDDLIAVMLIAVVANKLFSLVFKTEPPTAR